MKIIAAAAAYTLLEIALLMSTTVPLHFSPAASSYRYFVWWAQLLLIPGIVTVFSYFEFGRRNWWRRTLVTFSVAILFVASPSLPLILVALFVEWIGRNGVEFSTPADSWLIGAFFVSLMAAVVAAAIRFIKMMARRSVRMESDRWLGERRTGVDRSKIRSRHWPIRWAVGMPSSFVLIVFLFLPEIWGTIWRATEPCASLPGFEVSLPPTWFATYTTNQESSAIGGYVGTGVARGFHLYREWYAPLSIWEVRVVFPGQQEPYDYREPRRTPVLSRRGLKIGGELVTCTQYSTNLVTWKSSLPREPVSILCSGPGRLRASFFGEQTHLAQFYHLLESIKPKN